MNKAGRRVLVVDDMTSIRSVVMALLKSEGYEAFGAGNGQAALDLLSKKQFDLVLSDWSMPEMNGSELVQRIRATNTKLPIIMVTAESDPGRVTELRDLGVNGYLIKPFKPAALMAVLGRLFPSGSKNAA
jgi:two-component system chemotaxis response regulator CheY